MKVIFASDQAISYNGVNVSSYTAGVAYEPSHEKERAFFQSALDNGTAHPHIDGPAKTHPALKAEKKVLTPKNKK